MVESIANAFQNIGVATTSDKKLESKNQALGQEDFLKLMTTQMTHQDPNKPMENGDFLAQMAQFSTVEGVGQLNDSFTEFANSISSGQALQAATLVGQSVMIASDKGSVSLTDKLLGEVVLKNNTDDLNVSFVGLDGEIVKTLNLGKQEKGNVSFEWDGQLDDGTYADPGTYTIKAEATVDGANTALQTFVNANVKSVAIGNSSEGITLALEHLGEVNFNDIKKIF